jgi:DNA-binding GntR family transcriptional regulator
VEEIFELKKLIEGNVAEKAAENLSNEDADELRMIVAGKCKTAQARTRSC